MLFIAMFSLETKWTLSRNMSCPIAFIATNWSWSLSISISRCASPHILPLSQCETSLSPLTSCLYQQRCHFVYFRVHGQQAFFKVCQAFVVSINWRGRRRDSANRSMTVPIRFFFQMDESLCDFPGLLQITGLMHADH